MRSRWWFWPPTESGFPAVLQWCWWSCLRAAKMHSLQLAEPPKSSHLFAPKTSSSAKGRQSRKRPVQVQSLFRSCLRFVWWCFCVDTFGEFTTCCWQPAKLIYCSEFMAVDWLHRLRWEREATLATCGSTRDRRALGWLKLAPKLSHRKQQQQQQMAESRSRHALNFYYITSNGSSWRIKLLECFRAPSSRGDHRALCICRSTIGKA